MGKQLSIFSPVGHFFEGVRAPWEGYLYLRQHRSLWKYAIIPVMLNLLITGVVITALIYSTTLYGEYIHPFFEGGWWWTILEAVAVVVLFIVAVLLVVAVWLLLSAIFCSYFYSKLAEKVEILLGTPKDQINEVSVWYQVVDAIRALVSLGLITLGLMLFYIIPVIGASLAVGSTMYFNSYVFGYDYFDYPLELRGIRRREKLEFVRSHRAHTVGLGAVVLLFNFIPIVGSVVLTTATVGAVLLHKRLS